ncbi:hypothetical protein SO802_003080 [Lithocarpus litseifolius]|uniref:RNase H type-1 domain-containing protein n=1 Tax=Lithocarpus litseifolius TaxID=425828 RepID=A0AAW2E4R5_9ROSI
MCGFGLKKFKYMNQAMLNKHYWRLCQNPNSLFAKIVKAKYFPTSSIQEDRAKPHHSWVWRNIIKAEHPFMREGKWIVGNGYNIPLNHKDWFSHSNLSVYQPHLPTGTVGDLIDHDNRTWKANLVRSLYPFHQASTILQIPISKKNSIQDKLCLKFSNNGEYQVYKAYDILSRKNASQSRFFQAHSGWWRSFWKIKDVFITLWAIWNYRNKVVHQEIIPNPMEVILIAHNFSCRVASTTARTATRALLEAIIEARLAAKAQGFQNILFNTDSKGLMQTIKKECVTDWMDSTRLARLLLPESEWLVL